LKKGFFKKLLAFFNKMLLRNHKPTIIFILFNGCSCPVPPFWALLPAAADCCCPSPSEELPSVSAEESSAGGFSCCFDFLIGWFGFALASIVDAGCFLAFPFCWT
jgi:hypothetical protein